MEGHLVDGAHGTAMRAPGPLPRLAAARRASKGRRGKPVSVSRIALVALALAAVAAAIDVAVAHRRSAQAAAALEKTGDARPAPVPAAAQAIAAVLAPAASTTSIVAAPSPRPRVAAPVAPPAPAVIARARRFTDNRRWSKDAVEQLLHVGSPFAGQTFKGVHALENGDGQPTSNFGVQYRYRWGAGGWTDVAYICDSAGVVTGLQVLRSNGEELRAPFAGAQGGATAFGALLLALAARDARSTADDTAMIRDLVNARDVVKLLDVYLTLAQRVDEAAPPPEEAAVARK